MAQTEVPSTSTSSRKETGMDILKSRTGGAYIPPARLRMMQRNIEDKNSLEYQRIAWEALKKSINGLINKVNVSNIAIIVRELFKENLVRGRGLFVRSLIQAQSASPTFTHVYAALATIVNTKFPQIGELTIKRLILQFRRGYRRNDKPICLSSTRFIAHLVNQEIAHEVLALELLTLMLENTTNDSVEVAIGFLKEVGMKLTELSPRGVHAIFEQLRSILHEGNLDKRVQYMIEVMFAIRKDGFKDHLSVLPELDLLEESEQCTHMMTLEDAAEAEDKLNVFQFDPTYQDNEEKYKAIKRDILDRGSSDDDRDSDEDSDDEDEDEDEEDDEEKKMNIIDNTETNLIALRRTIYLTIQASLDFEECAHKLLKLELKTEQLSELCHMIIDCCAQQRTYFKFYGLLAQRFCLLNQEYIDPFCEIFRTCYDTIHRFETNKLRNVAKLFGHLLFTDAIPWTVLQHIKLNEEDTTSSSRVFIKYIFQELVEYMGLTKLNNRLKDETLSEAFKGIFPRDNPRNTRFSINFFTSIGLGGLTDDLREFLKTMPRAAVIPQVIQAPVESTSSPSSSSSSSSSSDSSDDSSSSDSSSGSGSDSSASDRRKGLKSGRAVDGSKRNKREGHGEAFVPGESGRSHRPRLEPQRHEREDEFGRRPRNDFNQSQNRYVNKNDEMMRNKFNEMYGKIKGRENEDEQIQRDSFEPARAEINQRQEYRDREKARKLRHKARENEENESSGSDRAKMRSKKDGKMKKRADEKSEDSKFERSTRDRREHRRDSRDRQEVRKSSEKSKKDRNYSHGESSRNYSKEGHNFSENEENVSHKHHQMTASQSGKRRDAEKELSHEKRDHKSKREQSEESNGDDREINRGRGKMTSVIAAPPKRYEEDVNIKHEMDRSRRHSEDEEPLKARNVNKDSRRDKGERSRRDRRSHIGEHGQVSEVSRGRRSRRRDEREEKRKRRYSDDSDDGTRPKDDRRSRHGRDRDEKSSKRRRQDDGDRETDDEEEIRNRNKEEERRIRMALIDKQQRREEESASGRTVK